MLELRRCPRGLTFRTAKIIRDHPAEPVDCAVLDISEDGTCVMVADAAAVPDRFCLQVDYDGWSRVCRVVWRKQHRLGLRFVADAAATQDMGQV
jgi:hypothetical protein